MDLKKRKFQDEDSNDLESEDATLEVGALFLCSRWAHTRPGIQKGSYLETDEGVQKAVRSNAG